MKSTMKTMVILAVTVSIAFFVTIYTSCAYIVASHVFEDNGVLFLPYGYSFFPWPTIPTGITPSVLLRLTEVDLQYYQYIIKSGVLIALTIVSWLPVLWSIFKLKRNRPLSAQSSST